MSYSGYTVTPDVVYNEAGEATLVDFDIHSQQGFDSSSERFGGTLYDYNIDQYGDEHYAFEDVELGADEYSDDDIQDDYVSSLFDQYEDLYPAVKDYMRRL